MFGLNGNNSMKYHVKVCAVETQTLLQNTLFKRESRVLPITANAGQEVYSTGVIKILRDAKKKKKRGVISQMNT